MTPKRLVLQLHDCFHADQVMAQIVALRLTQQTPLGHADVPFVIHDIAMVAVPTGDLVRTNLIECLVLVDVIDVPPEVPLQPWLELSGRRVALDALGDPRFRQAQRDEMLRDLEARRRRS